MTEVRTTPRTLKTLPERSTEAELVFPSERAFTAVRPPSQVVPAADPLRRRWISRNGTLTVLGVLLLAGAATVAAMALRPLRPAALPAVGSTPPPAPPAVKEGNATISTRPEGAQVIVDGIVRGVTPLKLSLAAGEHALQLQNGSAMRSLLIAIAAGTTLSQYVDLAPGAVVPASGRLDVTSDPPGARVAVDDVVRGMTPVVIGAISPGEHRVVIGQGEAAVTRTVTVGAGTTAMVVASIAPAGASAGWIAIAVPIELQILEAGRLIGTTTASRLMLPVGQHSLDLVSTPFKFQTTVPVQVLAGKTVTIPVSLPTGSLSINATPWADVSIDDKPAGTTPLANLQVSIGTHEIVWKHPQLGERRQTVAVTAQGPTRVGIDFKK